MLRSAALHLSFSGFLSEVRIDYCLVEVRKASLEVDWMCFLGRIVVFKIRFHLSKHLSPLSHVPGRDYAGWDYIHNTSVLGEMCEKNHDSTTQLGSRDECLFMHFKIVKMCGLSNLAVSQVNHNLICPGWCKIFFRFIHKIFPLSKYFSPPWPLINDEVWNYCLVRWIWTD